MKKRSIYLVLAAAVLSLSLTACGGSTSGTSSEASSGSSASASTSESSSSENASSAKSDADEVDYADLYRNMNLAPTGEIVNPSSENWEDLIITINGQEIAFSDPLRNWVSNDFVLDETFPGTKNGLEDITPDGTERTSIYLMYPNATQYEKERYGDGIYRMELRVFSEDSEGRKVADRPVCYLGASRYVALYQTFSYKEAWEGSPDIVLAKGITWGSSLEEIKTAYGEPSKETISNDPIPRSEETEPVHTIYYYSTDGDVIMKFQVSEWSGLQYMELQQG